MIVIPTVGIVPTVAKPAYTIMRACQAPRQVVNLPSQQVVNLPCKSFRGSGKGAAPKGREQETGRDEGERSR